MKQCKICDLKGCKCDMTVTLTDSGNVSTTTSVLHIATVKKLLTVFSWDGFSTGLPGVIASSAGSYLGNCFSVSCKPWKMPMSMTSFRAPLLYKSGTADNLVGYVTFNSNGNVVFVFPSGLVATETLTLYAGSTSWVSC